MSKQDLILTVKDGVRLIKFNRPNRRNAISPDMYNDIKNTLNSDATNDNVVVTIITGAGEYYSSGNDITAAMDFGVDGLPVVRDLVNAFINYPKLLIAVVNGPAIGIATTTLALCDIVYATDRATFDTPFVKLGLCAEGASSYTFPLILGKSKASEMLYLNHKLSAQEALQFGFVSKVIPQYDLDRFIDSLKVYGKLSPAMVKITKKLISQNYTDILRACNEREIKQLGECFQSEEFTKAIMNFMSRKSKL